MSSLSTSLAYITQIASAEDINRIVAACNERNKSLRAAAAAKTITELNEGDAVELTGLRPKYLNGLTGTFVRLDTHGNKTTVVVKLDPVSVIQAGPRYVGARNTINVPTSAVRRVYDHA